MKVRYLLPILVLAAQIAEGATLKFPKDAPQFSIEMPDTWSTEAKGDILTSRPSKESHVIFSVFPVTGAKSLADAFAIAAKQVCEGYSDCNLGKSSQEKHAGVQFMGAEAIAKKDGTDIRIFLYVLGADSQRYFAITRAFDVASGEKYGSQIDGVMDSIKSLKEEERKAKEDDDKAESTVAFPKDKPAFTMRVPNSFGIDATAERLIVRATKKHKSFLYFASVPAGDGVSDEASVKAWLPKKGQALLASLGVKEANAFQEVEDFIYKIAGNRAFEGRYSGADEIDELRMWIFTPDGKRYFYAYYQQRTADMFEDDEAGINGSWQHDLLRSINPAK